MARLLPKQSDADLELLRLLLKSGTVEERIRQIIITLLCRLQILSEVDGLSTEVLVEPAPSLHLHTSFFLSTRLVREREGDLWKSFISGCELKLGL